MSCGCEVNDQEVAEVCRRASPLEEWVMSFLKKLKGNNHSQGRLAMLDPSIFLKKDKTKLGFVLDGLVTCRVYDDQEIPYPRSIRHRHLRCFFFLNCPNS